MPKTVLFFDHTAALGGGEVALLQLVQHLDRSRYRPLVVLASDGPLRAELLRAGVETHVIPLAPNVVHTRKDSLGGASLLRLGAIAQTLSYIRRLARFIRSRRADIVHTNSLKADIIGGISARLARVPVLWHVRDRIADDYLPAATARAFRLLCRVLPDYIIANSAATLETLHLPARNRRRGRGGAHTTGHAPATRKGCVVHDGVIDGVKREEQTAEAQIADQHIEANSLCIGIVGRISPWKGQHVFIKAAAAVRTQFPDARFQIIGSALFGEEAYEQEIRALAASLGLDGCLQWTGFVSNVMDFVRELDVLVHASTSGEPFGLVVVEGMVAGKPVVATNGGGVPEIVLHGVTGLLVPMGDASAMAAAIMHLLAHPEMARAMGQAGRERFEKHFTIEHTARKVQAVYEEMEEMGKRKRGLRQAAGYRNYML
jgi:glycosyltransferase involved in cell wall biosynthesis